MEPLEIRPGLVIPASELTARFTRATGPGGQNVNKVATRVTLRFALARSESLPEEVRERLRRLARRRLSPRGEILLISQRHREQARNLEDCRSKLRAMIRAALVPPRRRVRTVPTARSIERRLQEKARRAVKKRRRGAAEMGEKE